MTTVWVVVGLGVLAAIIAIVASRQRQDHHSDFGSVSHQWISEHRFGQADDRRR